MANPQCKMCEGETDKTYVFRVFHLERVKIDKGFVAPNPSAECQMAADSSHLYYPGCYNPKSADRPYRDRSKRFQRLWKLNLASKRWTSCRNNQNSVLPTNPIFTSGSTLLMYGATDRVQDRGNKLHVWDVKNKNRVIVEMKTTGERPPLLSGQNIIFYDGCLYTVGGRDENFFSWDIHRLDVKEMNWQKIYACNEEDRKTISKRTIYVLAFDGEIIYVVGGGIKKNWYNMYCFDMEKKRWFTQDTFPDPEYGYPPLRLAPNSVQITVEGVRQLFIIGGHQIGTVLIDFWKLDLGTRQWTCFDVNHLPQPAFYQGCCVTPQGRLYVFGMHCGYENRTTILHSAWLCVPTLSEMCWDAVLHYIPNINKCRMDDLVGMGIPKRFLLRLDSTNG